MNGEVCCILGVCCAPERAIESLAKAMRKDWKVSEMHALEYAAWINEHFDLAPKNTLADLKAKIGALAKEHA